MQASATMFLISDAEKYYSLSTILLRSELDRSYSMSFMLRTTISRRASLSGFPMYMSLLNLRLAALSSSFGKLVAPITRTSPLLGLLMPSIRTRNSVLSLRDASFSCSDLEVSIESIQSMKMILGAICSAAQKTRFIIFSDSPTSLFMIEDAEMAKKAHYDSLARALQMKVLPLPGGPQRSSPLGGALIPVYKSGLCRGLMTASSSRIFTSLSPTMSLKETSNFLTSNSYMAGSSYTFFCFSCFQNKGLRLSLAEYFFGRVYGFNSQMSAFFLKLAISTVWLCCLGKPNLVIFIFLASFSLCLREAEAFFSINFAILFLMASILSLEVAWVRASFRRRMILSQHPMAKSWFPSERYRSALAESSLASFNLSITPEVGSAIHYNLIIFEQFKPEICSSQVYQMMEWEFCSPQFPME